MSNLSIQTIKTLNKYELKLQRIRLGLDEQGKREDLVKRLTKAISEITNDAKSTSSQQKVLIYQ